MTVSTYVYVILWDLSMQFIDQHFCNNNNDDNDDNDIIITIIIIIKCSSPFICYRHSIVMIGVIVRAFWLMRGKLFRVI